MHRETGAHRHDQYDFHSLSSSEQQEPDSPRYEELLYEALFSYFFLRTRTFAVETFSSSGCRNLVHRPLSIDGSGRGTHVADGRVGGRGGYKEMISFS